VLLGHVASGPTASSLSCKELVSRDFLLRRPMMDPRSLANQDKRHSMNGHEMIPGVAWFASLCSLRPIPFPTMGVYSICQTGEVWSFSAFSPISLAANSP